MPGPWARWKAWRETRTLAMRPIPDALWEQTLARYPFLAWRTEADLLRLRELSTLFLKDKEFSGVGELQVTDEMAVHIAAQACLPIIAFSLDCYDGFKGIVIHQGAVSARRETVDEHGVVHQYVEELTGEAMQGGPVMLSWQDVVEGGQSAKWGYNVVVHEFVHVLHQHRGSAQLDSNGANPAAWAESLQDQYRQFCVSINDGVDALLDRYAAENIEEFLAVAAETFFVMPSELRYRLPRLYQLLAEYFEQDPASTAHTQITTRTVRECNRPWH